MLQKVVIIGAGPAGLLLAHYLLLRGNYTVAIYERRADPRSRDFAQGRTFPISLQERGRKALRGIEGLEEAIALESVFCQGTVIYQKNGKSRSIPRKNSILTIDRQRLVAILLEQLLANADPDRVKIQFECTCTHIERVAKTVTLQPSIGEEFTVNYDLLIGADGARSQVREDLSQDAGWKCEQTYISDAYKSVFLTRIDRSQGLQLAPDKIHTGNLDQNTRMIMVPQPGDRLNGVIIFNADNNPIAGLSTSAEVLAFLRENFPIFGRLMSPEEAEAFLNRPMARVLTVRCDRFHYGDSILLLGDAAHAVSPSIGQGCNASLEDVLILEQLLTKFEDDWAQVLPAFSQQRVPEAHALRELSDYSFPRQKLLVIEFFLRMRFRRLLNRWFPQWVKPFVFDLVLDSDLSYSQVLKLSQGWIDKVKRSMSGST